MRKLIHNAIEPTFDVFPVQHPAWRYGAITGRTLATWFTKPNCLTQCPLLTIQEAIFSWKTTEVA